MLKGYKMEWKDNVCGVAVGVIDYGHNFGPRTRKEYTIVTFDKNNEQDTIPGHYINIADARTRATELKRQCSCGVRPDVSLSVDQDEKDKRIRENRSTTFCQNLVSTAQKRYDNLH